MIATTQTGLFITGTDTGVGKTQVGAALAHSLVRQGQRVRIRKPVESGASVTPQGLLPEDARMLNLAAGSPDPLAMVCPHPLTAALSPPRAALLEGKSHSLRQLHQDCLTQLEPDDFLLVEGAGGFCSPLCRDGLNADLAARLGLPILLVVANRLGCINHTLLTLEAITSRDLEVAAIVLNHSHGEQPDAMDNAGELTRYCEPAVIEFTTSTTSPPWRGLPGERLLSLFGHTD